MRVISMRFCSLLFMLVCACGAVENLPIDTPETCRAACANLKRMECDGWRPTCVDMCITFTAEPGVSFNSGCVAGVRTCLGADACLNNH